MFKPFAFAFAVSVPLFAAAAAQAVECRTASGETFTAGAPLAGSSLAVASCLTPTAGPDGRRPLSPLLQLYDRPSASLDVMLHGRRARSAPALPSPVGPPAATVSVPTREASPPTPRRLRTPKPGVVIARNMGAARAGYAYAPTIYSVARAYDIDPAFMGALIRRESGLNPAAVSQAGARGFMQVMPGTAARFGVRGRQLDNPVANLAVGAAYLKTLQRRYGNNLPLILAAYNAGEGAVDRHGRRIPPYRETQGYVVGVLGDYGRTVARRSAR